MAIKAKEFDKVDFIKKLAECEGKIKILEDEKYNLDKALEREKVKNDKLKSDLETSNNKINMLKDELK